jgi:hypothetical protein
MLLPYEMNPENSIYFQVSIVIESLKCHKNLDVIGLYGIVKKNKISFPNMILCLDWLFLIEVAVVDDKGLVKLCS